MKNKNKKKTRQRVHSKIKEIRLNEVISNSKSIDLLMQHLGNEFSRECLLSLIEFIQFEQYIYDCLAYRQKRLKTKTTNTNTNTTTMTTCTNTATTTNKDKVSVISTTQVPIDGDTLASSTSPICKSLSPDSSVHQNTSGHNSIQNFSGSDIATEIGTSAKELKPTNSDVQLSERILIGTNKGIAISIPAMSPTISDGIDRNDNDTNNDNDNSNDDGNDNGNNLNQVSITSLSDASNTIAIATNSMIDLNDSIRQGMICNKFEIKLPKSIPKSEIVYGIDQSNNEIKKNQELIVSKYNEWIEDIQKKCYQLYKKYIAIGCEYEINIAGRTRRELFELMDNKEMFLLNSEINEIKLITMYNSSARDMYALIQGSFARFKASGTFKKLLIAGEV